MKNRFTTAYLYLFIADAVVLLFRSLLNVLDIHSLAGPPFTWIEMSFHTLVLLLAIAQSIIAFTQKQKKSAKIIGLYPVALTVVTLTVGIGLFAANFNQIGDKNMSGFINGITFVNFAESLAQLFLGFWAAKDFIGGHYPVESQRRSPLRRYVLDVLLPW